MTTPTPAAPAPVMPTVHLGDGLTVSAIGLGAMA